MEQRKRRYGVIGTGWITEAYIQGAARTGEWGAGRCLFPAARNGGKALAGQYRPDGQEAVQVVSTPEELAHTDIEAVYVASPNALHVPQSRLLLEHGKHVLCEKPIAIRPEEFDELAALARRKRLVYLEAIMMLHLPARGILHEALPPAGPYSHRTAGFLPAVLQIPPVSGREKSQHLQSPLRHRLPDGPGPLLRIRRPGPVRPSRVSGSLRRLSAAPWAAPLPCWRTAGAARCSVIRISWSP